MLGHARSTYPARRSNSSLRSIVISTASCSIRRVIQAPIKLDSSTRPCSYRELLTASEKVRTAATDAVRGGVRQAILVAEVKNDQCSGLGLIDFIFNEDRGVWKLFSAP